MPRVSINRGLELERKGRDLRVIVATRKIVERKEHSKYK